MACSFFPTCQFYVTNIYCLRHPLARKPTPPLVNSPNKATEKE